MDEECQNNFVKILERALELGVNHFETARGYGCSELQYGDALKQLFARGTKREDLILQTKVSPFATPEEFRETLELSLSLLGVDYIAGDPRSASRPAGNYVNYQVRVRP